MAYDRSLREADARRAHGLAALCGGLLALGLILACAPHAAAQQSDTPSPHEPGGLMDQSPMTRPQMLSFFTGIYYGHFGGYGFPWGFSGRYYLPILHDGFIPPVNDEFGIEFGADFYIDFLDSNVYNQSVLLGIGFPVDAMWDFHFTPHFDAYGKLGLVFSTGFGSHYNDFWFTVRTAIGLRWQLNDRLYFRAEVGYPAILVGLGIAM